MRYDEVSRRMDGGMDGWMDEFVFIPRAFYAVRG